MAALCVGSVVCECYSVLHALCMLEAVLWSTLYVDSLIEDFDYNQAVASNLTNPASLTHERSFLPVF